MGVGQPRGGEMGWRLSLVAAALAEVELHSRRSKVVPAPATLTHHSGLDYRSHDMKLLVFLFFLVAASAVAAQYSAYDFAGNTTIADDPHHLLNYRYLDYSSEDDERLCFLRSLRSNMNADHDYDEIDTIGSLVSYTSFPSTFLAFWEGEAQWSNDSFDTSNGTLSYRHCKSTKEGD